MVDTSHENRGPPGQDNEAGTRPPARTLPRLANDQGAAEIRIGVRAFECIGASPPHDHPNIYLDMGADPNIVCPYCSTPYRFDPSLEPAHSVPPGAVKGDPAQ